jgi:hypothetical protein
MDDLSFLDSQKRTVNMRGDGVGMVEYGGGDGGMVVMFFNKEHHNPQKSLAQGSPQFDNQVFVRVHPPGERLSIVERPARSDDVRRWPRQWEQFQRNSEQIPDGTPIQLLYPEKPAIAATLRAGGVHTVEQCANMSAHAIENTGMGCQAWVNAAQNYIKVASKGVGLAKFRSELEDRDRQIKVLQTQVHDLTNMVKEMQAARVQMADAMGQAVIAGGMMRPQHMPNVAFDPQLHQINNTSAGARQRQNPRVAPSLRQRVRLKNA